MWTCGSNPQVSLSARISDRVSASDFGNSNFGSSGHSSQATRKATLRTGHSPVIASSRRRSAASISAKFDFAEEILIFRPSGFEISTSVRLSRVR